MEMSLSNSHFYLKRELACLSSLKASDSILNAESFFSKLDQISFEKGEFESSKSYADRINLSAESNGLSLKNTIYVRKKFEPKYALYDADTKVLSFKKWGDYRTNSSFAP